MTQKVLALISIVVLLKKSQTNMANTMPLYMDMDDKVKYAYMF